MIETLLSILAVPIIVIVLVGLLIMKVARGRRVPSRNFTVDRRQFLSAREMDAFRMLVPIASSANLHVCPQASIDSFLKFGGEAGFGERNRYKARRSDFALMDASGSVVLVVEVDDATHRGREQQDHDRDEVIRMSGVTTVRIPAGRLPHVSDVQRTIMEALPTRSSRR